MAESPRGIVEVLPPEVRQLPAKKKRTKKDAIDLPTLVIASEPVLAAGLTLLENVPRLRPYVTALRLLSTAGRIYATNDKQQKGLEQIKKLRKQMLRLDATSPKYATLNAKLLRAIDKL